MTKTGRAELEAELQMLERRRTQLLAGLAEFQHSGRRIADGLERVGGRQADLELRRSELARNERLTHNDLAAIDKATKEIRRALSEHTADE